MRWLYKVPLRLHSLFKRGLVEQELTDARSRPSLLQSFLILVTAAPEPERRIAFGGVRMNAIGRSKIENGNSGSTAQNGKPRKAADLRPTELSFAGGARITLGEE